MKETELENKLQELSKRYFQTNNGAVQHQIVMLIENYKQELYARRAKTWQEQNEKRDTGLDNLINIS